MTLAGRVSEEQRRLRADAVFVDGTGVGGGVVDRLRQLRCPVFDIQFGAKSDAAWMEGNDGEKYANKRSEIWGALRSWLKGGAIPDQKELLAELTGPQYGFNVRNEIQLERKEDMKKRGLASPDYGDALALTFAYPVQASALAGRDGAPALHESDYDPFSARHMETAA